MTKIDGKSISLEVMPGSLLARDESAAIKGILIFLIVLGHNRAFVKTFDPYYGGQFLYLFHIHCFFILPFLYNWKRLSMKRIADYAIRFLWPLCWLSLLLTIAVSCIWHPQKIVWGELLPGIICGNAFVFHKYMNVQYLWFLPAMFLLMCIRDGFASARHLPKLVICLVSFFFYFIYPVAFESSVRGMYPNLTMFARIMGYPFIALLIRWMIERWKVSRHMAICFVLVLSLCFFTSVLCPEAYPWSLYHLSYALAWRLMPLAVILLMYSYREKLAKRRLFREFGSHSLLIFFVHVPFSAVVYFLLVKCPLNCSLDIILSQILIVGLSYACSRFLDCVPWLRKSLFPQKVQGWLFHDKSVSAL